MAKVLDENTLLTVPLLWGAASDVGRARDENEDSFATGPELGLFLVSDGMGGHQGGAIASRVVAEVLPIMVGDRLAKTKARSTTAIRSMIKKTIVELNAHVLKEAVSERGLCGMAATLVMVLLRQERAFIANMGDSRAYLFRKHKLRQLTEDHSVISELLQQGRIEAPECENHPEQGRITRYVGTQGQVCPWVRTIGLKEQDRLLLCTDGLTDAVADKDIAAVLADETDCRTVCRKLVEAANIAGGHDNITVVVIDWLTYPK